MNISMGLRKLINSIVNYKISINFKIHFIIVTNSELIYKAFNFIKKKKTISLRFEDLSVYQYNHINYNQSLHLYDVFSKFQEISFIIFIKFQDISFSVVV